MDQSLPELSVEAFLTRLASEAPTPGGGSAAALAGAMGAALLHMVVQLTADRPAGAEHHETLTELRGAAAAWQSELLRLAELDASAYEGVIRARRLPRTTERESESRTVQLAAAMREATRVPLEVTRRAGELIGIAERLAPIGNRNAISDVGVGALLAAAAVRGAAQNVRINLPYLPDDDPLRDEADDVLTDVLRHLDERERALQATVEERLA
jgi:methenyltetrahydrofolate cyclohydrolase